MAQLMNQTVHVRFDGRSEELNFAMLKLTNGANDTQIKQAVARHFDLPQNYLDGLVVVRTNNAIIIRPEAIYG